MVARIATGEADQTLTETLQSAAAELGRKGGKARAANMSPERRAEIAREQRQGNAGRKTKLDLVGFFDHLVVRKTDKDWRMDGDEGEGLPRFVETVIRKEPWEVIPRLHELKTTLEALLSVRDVALSEAANGLTPFRCSNAPGTFGYQHGVFKLRYEHVGDVWNVDRSEGVEGIIDHVAGVRFLFSNVDIACDDEKAPKPRSRKGSGSERVCEGDLFGDLPHFAPRQRQGIATFYVMIDERGAVELSRPVISGETFSSFIERNYISSGGGDFGNLLPLTDDDALVEFDPLVARN